MLREVGYERLSIDGVAARAGVGKTTIYRWYKNKDELVIEALASAAKGLEDRTPNTGKLASDIQALVQDRIDQDPLCFNRQSMALTISALAGSPQLAQTYWDLYIAKKREAHTKIFERAKKRGELAEDADVDLFLDLLHGYILFGLLVRPKGSVSPKGAASVVKTLLAGFAPRD
jgi:AcrR family transcriptional regulator